MNGLSAVLLILAIQQCPQCPQSAAGGTIPRSQFDGLKNAVDRQQNEVKQLTEGTDRIPRLADEHPTDEQVAVVDLADSMVDNLLLTRAYLALAVAELKLISIADQTCSLSEHQKTRYLRHIEAIQLAIDERILERDDLRVYRVLQAGVNQALRLEMQRLASQSNSYCQPHCSRRRHSRIGLIFPCLVK